MHLMVLDFSFIYHLYLSNEIWDSLALLSWFSKIKYWHFFIYRQENVVVKIAVSTKLFYIHLKFFRENLEKYYTLTIKYIFKM